MEYTLKKFRYDDIQMVKGEVLKDASFILCQCNRGEKMEDILIRKIEKIAKTQQIIEKCKEK